MGVYRHAYTHFRVTLHAFHCGLVNGAQPQPLQAQRPALGERWPSCRPSRWARSIARLPATCWRRRTEMLIVDAHQDLAWNMLTFGRDYTRPVAETRRWRPGGPTPELNGDIPAGLARIPARAVWPWCSPPCSPPRERMCTGTWKQMCYADSAQAQAPLPGPDRCLRAAGGRAPG